MRAFIVGTDHIDFLITAANAWDVRWYFKPSNGGPTMHGSALGDLDTLGMRLLAENAASVSHRYAHCDDLSADETGETAAFYRHRFVPLTALDPVHVLKAAQCYEYQSCEHPGWADSEACAFVEALKATAINRLPGIAAAPWHWTREKATAGR